LLRHFNLESDADKISCLAACHDSTFAALFIHPLGMETRDDEAAISICCCQLLVFHLQLPHPAQQPSSSPPTPSPHPWLRIDAFLSNSKHRSCFLFNSRPIDSILHPKVCHLQV
jgi:hypothetical protein